jgi:hypothetical protein
LRQILIPNPDEFTSRHSGAQLVLLLSIAYLDISPPDTSSSSAAAAAGWREFSRIL